MALKVTYIPGNETLVTVFGTDEEEELAKEKLPCSLLYISGFDWNADLSPWPADPVFSRGEPFAGKADDFIKEAEDIIRSYPAERRIAAGYSLAGMFALYFASKTDLFDGVISASGSLWYPDFTSYIAAHPLSCRSVYLSLGDQEAKTKNPVMASVLAKTEEMRDILKEYTDCVLEMNPGNHFKDPGLRLARGIRHML